MLKGRGVNPIVNISVRDGTLDMGDILVNDLKQEIVTVSDCRRLYIIIIGIIVFPGQGKDHARFP